MRVSRPVLRGPAGAIPVGYSPKAVWKRLIVQRCSSRLLQRS